MEIVTPVALRGRALRRSRTVMRMWMWVKAKGCLANVENLDSLSETVGVDISLIKTEASVGKYSVDILAEEDISVKKIIIENQLETTDHDHLGKIITYASGYDAEFIIWIVKDIRGEHQKAIEWLNNNTDDDISFFLIRIELWKIGDSKPAPKFEIAVSPNRWAKTIKANNTNKDLTVTKLQQLDFWTKLKEYIRKENLNIRLRTPRPQHWFDIAIGSSECHIALVLNTRENLIGCGIYIHNNKDLFQYFKSKRSLIEEKVNEEVKWVDATKASRIIINKKVNSLFDDSELDSNFDWLYTMTMLFQEVFIKQIKDYKQADLPVDE